MKKLLLTLTLSMGFLSGCGTTGTGIDATTAIGTATNVGMAVFQTAVDQKCRTELTNHQYWKIASLAMSQEKQTEVQTKICGCVSEKAPQSVAITDIATAAIDKTARAQVVAKAVSNTMQACYGEFVK